MCKAASRINLFEDNDDDDDDVSGYKNRTVGSNIVECDYGNKPGYGEVCAVDVDTWEPCTSANTFDYLNSTPCVFIKLNKVGPPLTFSNHELKAFDFDEFLATPETPGSKFGSFFEAVSDCVCLPEVKYENGCRSVWYFVQL